MASPSLYHFLQHQELHHAACQVPVPSKAYLAKDCTMYICPRSDLPGSVCVLHSVQTAAGISHLAPIPAAAFATATFSCQSEDRLPQH